MYWDARGDVGASLSRPLCVSPAMPAGGWQQREGQGGRGVGELPHPEFAIANPDAHRLFMGWRELYVFLLLWS